MMKKTEMVLNIVIKINKRVMLILIRIIMVKIIKDYMPVIH